MSRQGVLLNLIPFVKCPPLYIFSNDPWKRDSLQVHVATRLARFHNPTATGGTCTASQHAIPGTGGVVSVVRSWPVGSIPPIFLFGPQQCTTRGMYDVIPPLVVNLVIHSTPLYGRVAGDTMAT